MKKSGIYLGDSGIEISRLIFGTALTIGTERNEQRFCDQIIDLLWENDILAFDTSNNYGNGKAETLLGNSLKRYPRSEFILCTKGSWKIGDGLNSSGLGKKHIFNAIDTSLTRLKVDFVDIYYAHRYSPNISMERIVWNFNELISKGKILHWGISEWPLSALEECLTICEKYGLEGPIVQQNIYSYALHPSKSNGLLKYGQDRGLGFIGYSPLAQGALTGKYLDGIPDSSRIHKAQKIEYFKTSVIHEQNRASISKFLSLTRKYDLNPTHAAINWVIRDGVIPVFGASTPQQLLENIGSLDFMAPDEFWIELENNE